MTSSSWASCLSDARHERVVAPAHALVAELLEVGEGRLARRHREAREAVVLELEVDLAARRQLARVGDALVPGRCASARPRRRVPGGSAASSSRALEGVLAVRPAQVGALLERLAVADADEHVLELAVRRAARSARRWSRPSAARPRRRGTRARRPASRRRAAGGAAARRRAGPPRSPRRARRRAKSRASPGRGGRALPVAGEQAPRELAVAAARQRHEALGVPGEQLVGEARRALRARQVRGAGQPAEAR